MNSIHPETIISSGLNWLSADTVISVGVALLLFALSIGINFYFQRKTAEKHQHSTIAISNFMEMIPWMFAIERQVRQTERLQKSREALIFMATQVTGEGERRKVAESIKDISDILCDGEERNRTYHQHATERRKHAFDSLIALFKGNKKVVVTPPDQAELDGVEVKFKDPMISAMIYRDLVKMDELLVNVDKNLVNHDTTLIQLIEAMNNYYASHDEKSKASFETLGKVFVEQLVQDTGKITENQVTIDKKVNQILEEIKSNDKKPE